MPSTPNYLWELDDILGQGATACVYKARNKKSGEVVAVKVFNNLSYHRPPEVQMREFEMLRKLNHINIVKLFAVEQTGTSRQKVLVMEYCASGSLLSVLEEPENAFGLSESEFHIVVDCVVAGMNHLRQNGVVHRDIKPGNIMRVIGEDGRSIYKLSDFGAARELDDDEKFVSIYGTEEYLHPDMYERAVLRKPQQKVYGVTVDLWSIGVTFYHAACGRLPFIPYGGTRRNKETMYKITTEKPTGAIAGVQKKENGPIEWTYDLPINCQLSVGMKTQLEAILPNILEADQEKCWGFDNFFAETNKMLERINFHVFSLPQATMHRIYLHPYSTMANFMEVVATYTFMAPERQTYFYEGHHYLINPALEVRALPKTTEQYPLILIGNEFQTLNGVSFKDPSSDYPRFLPSVNVIGDYTTAKNVLSAVYQTLRVTRLLLRCQEFILRGTYWLIESIKEQCRRILDKNSSVVSILNCLVNINNKTTRLCNVIYKGNSEVLDMEGQGESLWKKQSIRDIMSTCSHNADKERVLGLLLLEVTKEQDQIRQDTSINRMEHCLQKMQQIFKQFNKRRQQPQLTYNEEQIHKLDKLNLGTLAKKVLLIFQEEVVLIYQTALSQHAIRIRTIFEIQNHFSLVNGYTADGIRDLQCYEETVSNTLEKLSQHFQQVGLVHSNHSPVNSCTHEVKDDLVLRMLQLRDQMKTVTYEMEHNNSIIERLGVPSSSQGT
ncbi:inhibitor of nuclear factor kappa-B kinase subunit epsilon [Pelobates cultripes]|uniref:Inhibitor of nuclear factor kappa-B kinase subunit epsilon n=1 Tax=Pelobates cultripes TaxID=61616 RepID=A0AAD1QZM4_PELCU|nr:inhibitor of nuclear factor kappa-B kinase subunit epsilon [Pelobates cultripes]